MFHNFIRFITEKIIFIETNQEVTLNGLRQLTIKYVLVSKQSHLQVGLDDTRGTWVLALPYIGCVILGKSLCLSEPRESLRKKYLPDQSQEIAERVI